MEVNFRKELYNDDSPIDIADLVFNSFPVYSAMEISRRFTQTIARRDHEMLESLHKVGYQTNFGPEGTGLMMLIPDRAGGYYLGGFIVEINQIQSNKPSATDEGTSSKLIAEGKVKIKSDCQISHFAERAIVFDDGSEIEADVVICATG